MTSKAAEITSSAFAFICRDLIRQKFPRKYLFFRHDLQNKPLLFILTTLECSKV